MEKLTVLFTTNHANTIGNACRLSIVDYLSKHFFTTIVTNKAEFLANHFPHCKIIGYDKNRHNKIPILSDIFEWRRLVKLINDLDSDLCFMFDDTSAVSNFIKIPVFQYVHQFGVRTNEKTNILKRIYSILASKFIDSFYFSGLKKSKIVFVVSRPIIDILQKNGISNLIHIPHGIELQKFSKPLINDFHLPLKKLKENGCFIITYTGWVTENRGFHLILNSIKEVIQKDKKAVLVIAGADNYYSEKIYEFSKNNNMQNNIINFGIIDSSLIPGILYFSDVCLSFLENNIPAYRISPPQKIIEYFAAGKPVICNKIQTHELLVKDGLTGFITHYDSKEVYYKILCLMRDEKLLKNMSKNALEEARKYDINLVYGNMVKKMREAINANNKK